MVIGVTTGKCFEAQLLTILVLLKSQLLRRSAFSLTSYFRPHSLLCNHDLARHDRLNRSDSQRLTFYTRQRIGQRDTRIHDGGS
jgi:hypothetical protein